MRLSAASTASSTLVFTSLTRCPTSRFASFGATLSHRSLTKVSTPFLRAIQRSRKIFQSFSFATAEPSASSAAKSSRAAVSSAAAEKSVSLGTLYGIAFVREIPQKLRNLCHPERGIVHEVDDPAVEGPRASWQRHRHRKEFSRKRRDQNPRTRYGCPCG